MPEFLAILAAIAFIASVCCNDAAAIIGMLIASFLMLAATFIQVYENQRS